jgi:hypothetical protein
MDLVGDHSDERTQEAFGGVFFMIGQSVAHLQKLGRHQQSGFGLFALGIRQYRFSGFHRVHPTFGGARRG